MTRLSDVPDRRGISSISPSLGLRTIPTLFSKRPEFTSSYPEDFKKHIDAKPDLVQHNKKFKT
jgi:hypothetical protein